MMFLALHVLLMIGLAAACGVDTLLRRAPIVLSSMRPNVPNAITRVLAAASPGIVVLWTEHRWSTVEVPEADAAEGEE
jgi:hypothetical protein